MTRIDLILEDGTRARLSTFELQDTATGDRVDRFEEPEVIGSRKKVEQALNLIARLWPLRSRPKSDGRKRILESKEGGCTFAVQRVGDALVIEIARANGEALAFTLCPKAALMIAQALQEEAS